MATKKPRKSPVKAEPAGKPDRLKESLREWHAATLGVLEGVRQIAADIVEELENRHSPLHDLIGNPCNLNEFLAHLDDADASLTFILARESQTVNVSIPNPVDGIRKK
jgi:hypothetical protein